MVFFPRRTFTVARFFFFLSSHNQTLFFSQHSISEGTLYSRLLYDVEAQGLTQIVTVARTQRRLKDDVKSADEACTVASEDKKKEKKRGCAIISHTQSYFVERTQAASHSHKKVDESEADSSGGLMHREITQEEMWCSR